MRIPVWLAPYQAAVRALLVATLVLGLVYPLLITAAARLPVLHGRAGGSLIERDGKVVGSSLIGQSFLDRDGQPLKQYVQSRPSAAGDGYDPTSTGASNLGPESVVDTVVDGMAKPGLLTQVCARSAAVGALEGVSGARPYCTTGKDGGAFGAVLAVYRADGFTGRVTRVVSVNQTAPAQPWLTTYEGVRVTVARPGETWTGAVITPVRGDAAADPVVPADAVTASGSGLDPGISPAYARLQEARIARERGISGAEVSRLVSEYTTGRGLGFLGEPTVDVVELNLALDREHPYQG